MKLVSFAELLAQRAVSHRTADDRADMRFEIEQAKIAQVQRHFEERLAADERRLAIQTESAERNEKTKGENALAEMARKHALEQSAKSSALIDEAWTGLVREQEEQNRVFWDGLRQLLLVEAQGIVQERSRRLESELGAFDAVLKNGVQDQRSLFDRVLDVAIKVKERELGLGDQPVDDEQVAEWVREAMEQSGGFD